MAKKRPRKTKRASVSAKPTTKKKSATRARTRRSATSTPPRTPAARRNTAESERGGQFVRCWKGFVAIRRNHGGKPFNKKMLAEWLTDDFDRDMDDLAEFYKARATAFSAAAMPQALQTIQEESRQRNAERLIVSLESIGFVFTRCDKNGNKPRTAASRSTKSTSTRRARTGSGSPRVWWKYDPSKCPVSKQLEAMMANFNLTPFELEGIFGCQALLRQFYDLKMGAGAKRVFDRIISSAPKKLVEEARAQENVWCFLLRRRAKYDSKQLFLQRWNDATILRTRCLIKYRASGEEPRIREVASLGTVFMPGEDSLYLIGCEMDTAAPETWKRPVQYKLDRVLDITSTDNPNPRLRDMHSHERIASRGRHDEAVLLDLEKLYADSIGAFFHYGETIRLVVRIHHPQIVDLCLERPFHPMQTWVHGPARDDITITVERCFRQEVVPKLLGFKHGFTVLHPPEVIEDIRTAATDILRNH